jgi:hypothetical protein
VAKIGRQKIKKKLSVLGPSIPCGCWSLIFVFYPSDQPITFDELPNGPQLFGILKSYERQQKSLESKLGHLIG